MKFTTAEEYTMDMQVLLRKLCEETVYLTDAEVIFLSRNLVSYVDEQKRSHFENYTQKGKD